MALDHHQYYLKYHLAVVVVPLLHIVVVGVVVRLEGSLHLPAEQVVVVHTVNHMARTVVVVALVAAANYTMVNKKIARYFQRDKTMAAYHKTQGLLLHYFHHNHY